MTTTKATIVDRVYDRIGGTKREITDIVETVIDTMKIELEHGGFIKLSGFGRFEIREKAARIGRNPKTKEEIMIQSRKVIRFKVSKVFKEDLNKNTPPQIAEEKNS